MKFRAKNVFVIHIVASIDDFKKIFIVILICCNYRVSAFIVLTPLTGNRRNEVREPALVEGLLAGESTVIDGSPVELQRLLHVLNTCLVFLV